jgi:hypothetical protein
MAQLTKDLAFAFAALNPSGFNRDLALLDIDTDLRDAVELFKFILNGIGAAAALDVFNVDDVFHKFSGVLSVGYPTAWRIRAPAQSSSRRH